MDEREFYERAGNVNGWDFSQIESETEGIAWDFYHEAARRSAAGGFLLDIGSGGGENLMAVTDHFGFVIGIDRSETMVETARTNLRETKQKNVCFLTMAAENLQFPSDFFDIVTSRHCPFNAKEAARVLRPGGIFLTQQVSEADKSELKKTFGRGQAFDVLDGTLKKRHEKELEKAGFIHIENCEYDTAEYYRRPEDLLFLLRHTPIIPGFGEKPEDWEKFSKFVENHQTERGIQTNSKRFLLCAQK